MSKIKNLTGKQFGRLLVIGLSPISKRLGGIKIMNLKLTDEQAKVLMEFLGKWSFQDYQEFCKNKKHYPFDAGQSDTILGDVYIALNSKLSKNNGRARKF